MQIRLFQTSDTNQVTDIIQRNLREVNIHDYTPDELKDIIDYFTPEQVEKNAQIRTVFVAVDGEKILWTAWYARSNNPEMEWAFLLTVFTRPENHGKWIGKKLVETTEEEAKKEGFRIMYVPSWRTAIWFYQKLGYNFMYFPPKEDAEWNTLMYKKL